MPEGHVIHRLARRQSDLIAGHRLRVASPQGRFAEGAAHLDGKRLTGIDAYGKHLFYRWEGSDSLHVHLGLFGRFWTHRTDPPEPSPATRLTLRSPDTSIYLSGPTVCELLSPGSEDELRSRLGPDPLADANGAATFFSALQRRRIPIGAALLEQRVVAGIGNVYRAEILFLEGLSPHRPANRVAEDEADRIWRRSVDELRRGERAGRIVTVEPDDVGASRRDRLPREARLYVYKRTGEPCRRCGSPIESADMAGRSIWWCGTCQPA